MEGDLYSWAQVQSLVDAARIEERALMSPLLLLGWLLAIVGWGVLIGRPVVRWLIT